MTPKRPNFPHILDFLSPRVAHELRYLICDLDLFFLGAKLTDTGRFVSRFPADMAVCFDVHKCLPDVHKPNYHQEVLPLDW